MDVSYEAIVGTDETWEFKWFPDSPELPGSQYQEKYNYLLRKIDNKWFVVTKERSDTND